ASFVVACLAMSLRRRPPTPATSLPSNHDNNINKNNINKHNNNSSSNGSNNNNNNSSNNNNNNNNSNNENNQNNNNDNNNNINSAGQSRGRAVGFAGDAASSRERLLPVEHDRSGHAERQAMLAMLESLDARSVRHA
ncbi:unnamed protein product, partial [Polarella glacialis]